MAQHDYDLANQAGAAFRSDLNAALAAIVTNNSGATAPATTHAHMWWADTSAGILKRRNAANTAWISVMSLTLAFSAIGESLAAAASASAARTAISAAASGANSDITSLSGLTTALSIAQGGTGQTSASNAINALLPSQTGNAGLVLITNGTTASWGSPLTVGASTTLSGTATDITGIRSGARRITVNFVLASTNGTSAIALQLGDSGGIETTGYVSGCASIDGTNATSAITVTAAFALVTASVAAAQYSGTVVLTRVDAATNAWVAHSSLSADNGLGYFQNGRKLLSAELDRLRITTLTGVNTFDGGSVTITVE